MSFNAFKYVEVLRGAGIPDKQAEAQVRVLNEIIESNLASKRDLKEMEQKLDHKLKEMEQRIIIKLGGLIVAALAAMSVLSQFNII